MIKWNKKEPAGNYNLQIKSLEYLILVMLLKKFRQYLDIKMTNIEHYYHNILLNYLS